ncbi:hypothetical protein K505DRAFT_381560, partial [Melanomma pulvis-pyrius CBS 109.77]
RITSIRTQLTEIQISVANREQLLDLASADHGYHITSSRNRRWKLWARDQNRRFYALEAQVARVGYAASIAEILDWERRVEPLRAGTLNCVDRFDAENAWAQYKEDGGGVLTPGWNWAGAAAVGGPGLDDELVCPLDALRPNPHHDAGRYAHLDSGKGSE